MLETSVSKSGKLGFFGRLKSLGDEAVFEQLLNKSVRHDWVVYAKRPFSSPACVLKYLARYTHRVAISNRRLVELRNGRVSFRYKDYSDDQQSKVLSLSGSEFIRRFLMHTLPSGFVRIRYYGFLANRYRNERLEQCRRLLGVTSEATPVIEETQTPAWKTLTRPHHQRPAQLVEAKAWQSSTSCPRHGPFRYDVLTC